MKRANALQTAERALHQAGYQVSRRCTSRESCFDFAARDDEHLILVKAFPDIRDVYRDVSAWIRTVACCFSSAAVFITDMKDEKNLRDDTVYLRYGVQVVTSKTFEDIVLRGSLPLVEAAPGGYYVRVDGSRIRELRHELGLSISKLGAMVGVSRRTLYGYERGMARASVSAAYELGKILGVPIAKAVDVFERALSFPHFNDPPSENCEDTGNRLLRFIVRKLTKLNIKVLPMNRTPFDFTAECPEAELKIVGGVFEKKDRRAKERMDEIVSLSKLVEARPLLLGEERIACTDDIVFLEHGELARIKDRKELTALL